MILALLELGRVAYAPALELQETLVTLRKQDRIPDTLLLLEHDAVLTLGRNAHRENIVATDEQLAANGVSIHEIKRGGDVTYHGPGQLVGYPILDLRSTFAAQPGLANLGARQSSASPETVVPRLGAVEYVRRLEEALIRACAEFRVPTERIAGRTGVWTIASPRQPERKVAAIGVHISAGITSHGFALNVTTNLADFDLIVPCGIADRGVTSLAQELAVRNRPAPSFEDVSAAMARQLGRVLGRQVLALESLEDLISG